MLKSLPKNWKYIILLFTVYCYLTQIENKTKHISSYQLPDKETDLRFWYYTEQYRQHKRAIYLPIRKLEAYTVIRFMSG